MSEHIYWVIEMHINPGQDQAFKTLVTEMVDFTNKNSPGTIAYDFSLTPDGKVCHIYEEFKDSAATVVHLNNFSNKFSNRLLSVCKPGRFVVYGPASAEVKKLLAGLNPSYNTPLVGFIR